MRRDKKIKKRGLPTKIIDSRALPAQPQPPVDANEDNEFEDGVDAPIEKIENWADDQEAPVYKAAQSIAEKIVQCFKNKNEQSDRIGEYWNIYNAQPDSNQQYTGNGTRYIPAARDAVNARRKRTLSMLFPSNHRHVEAIGPTGVAPLAQLSLLEHYIRACKLREIVSADLIAGDVTGQWNLYVDWTKSYRRIRELIKGPPAIQTADGDIVEVENLAAPEDDEEIEERDIIQEGPEICAVATEDVAIYPPTMDDISKATATAVRLRLTEDAIERFIEEGVFVGVEVEQLLENMRIPDAEGVNPNKKRTSDAFIKTEGTYKYALIHEIHTDMKLDGKRKEPVYVYSCGERIVGIIRNPRWSGKRPLLTCPIEKQTGSAFGISKLEPIKYLQWDLNDFWNMGMDSAQYGLLPIVMTDPQKNPNYASMTMGLAAVWLTDPASTKFQTFPQIWKDAIQMAQAIKSQIWESTDVNDAMLGKSPSGRKNQGMVGQMQQEQQINILDHARNYEDNMLSPLMAMVMEDDRQFRTESLTLVTRGEMGADAKITEVEPEQFGITYFYRWIGTSFQLNMQRVQQGIAWMNVLRGIPPQLLNGLTLDVTPIVRLGTEAIFGADMCANILVDQRAMFALPASEEDHILANGMEVHVHEGDNDAEHIASHNQAAIRTGDPSGYFRNHIQKHLAQLQTKRQKAMAAQGGGQPQGPGMPGVPGGQQPGGPGKAPGVPGTPRPGAIPAGPRPQAPAGNIPQEQLPGGVPRG